MLIQLHLLQNYAPANLNRDDSGSPKDAMFGGFRRGRVSSQCLKRSIRKSNAFEDAFKLEGLLGARTRLLPAEISRELKALGADEKTIEAIVEKVPQIGHKAKGKEADDGKEAEASKEKEEETELATRQLIFVGQNELRPLAEELLKLYKEWGKKWKDVELEAELKKSLPKSVDIAMFGRMTTSEAFEDVQAAVQVAHMLSTNALAPEFDYYTAVDDLSNETGAGMIGDVEFNSSTYYKYLSVHWEKLVENLGGDKEVARRAVLALVEAAAMAHPSGKQNSFAAHNPPDLVLLEVRERNVPMNYANAFLKPARPWLNGDKSVVDDSAEKLNDYVGKVSKAYGLNDKRAVLTLNGYEIPMAEAKESLVELQAWVETQLPR